MTLSVTCGTTTVLNYSAGTQSISLSATCAGATSFAWTLISLPIGSSALSQIRGDFVNGNSSVQNPSFVTDAGISGSYVFQCIGSNISGSSSPADDKDRGQQLLIIRTQNLGLTLPGSGAYSWTNTFNINYRILEDVYPNLLVNLNKSLGSSLDSATAARTPLSHVLTGTLHTSATLAQLNALISDATLDTATASRPPNGTVSGNLAGSFPGPTVQKLQGVGVIATGVQNNQSLIYSAAQASLYPTSVPSGIIGLTNANFSSYVNQQAKLVTADPTATFWQLSTMDDVKPLWPRFYCNLGNTNRNQIFAAAPPGASNTLRLILSDGKVYAATAPITIDVSTTGANARVSADTLATGLWHIYAVPATATTFQFVVSTRDPTVYPGPIGYPIYKYCWTVHFESITGGVTVSRFIQSGRWYHVVWLAQSAYRLMSWVNHYPKADTGVNVWKRFNGTDSLNMDSGSVTPGNIANVVPVNWVKTVEVNAIIAPATSGGSGGGIACYIMGGNVTGISGPFNARTGTTFIPYLNSMFLSCAGTQAGANHTGTVALIDKMMAIRFNDLSGYIFTGCSFGVWIRGYRNSLYGA